MDFIEVKEVPESLRKKPGKKGLLKAKLDKFMAMNIKNAKVVWSEHDYSNSMSCYNAFACAVRRHVLPIDVRVRNGEIYLMRRDL